MVKGWVEHREGARFKSQWGQRMEDKKITYQKKKKRNCYATMHVGVS